jgi:hypothetical protein
MCKTRAHSVVLAVSLCLPCAIARADDAADVARLRAELADRNKRIEKLEKKVAELTAALEKLTRAGDAGKAPKAPPAPAARKLAIRVQKDKWGNAGLRDIQAVLLSTGKEMWRFFPDRTLKPILVEHSDSGPISLYRRGPGGEYLVRLDVEGRHWAQFAYQFAHEFCHILCNYSSQAPRKYKWFEESLCETASAFALRRMALTWKTSPPYPNWKSFAAALQNYADDLLAKADKLPAKTTLAQWYKQNADALAKNPTMRDKNKVVAYQLLSLFEAAPQHWPAIGYLNRDGPAAKSFSAHLAAWRDRCPDKHKPFVKRIIQLFEDAPHHQSSK